MEEKFGKNFLAQGKVTLPILKYLTLHPLIYFALSALAQMRCLVKDAFRTSELYSTAYFLRVGRCHYHSSHIPNLRTVDDESLVKVNVGIGRQVDIRYVDRSHTIMKVLENSNLPAGFDNLQGQNLTALLSSS